MSEPVLLKRHQIDDRAWNALIDEARHAVVYAYTWYLDCVSPDWQALVVVDSGLATDHEGTPPFGYRMAMPLPVRWKWGMAVVQQPLFCQYLGLFSRKEILEADLALFLTSLSRHFPYISVYDFHPCHTVALRTLLPAYPGFEVQEKATHWLELDNPYINIAQGYTADRINNLRKSGKYDWEWKESRDVEPLITLFREYHAARIQGVHESAYVLLRRLTQLLQGKKIATIRYALWHGSVRAGIMILENRGMGIYIFNAAEEVGRKGNARTSLLDRYFQEKAGHLEIFDFESPEVPSIARFYQSFGASRQAFISLKKNKLPFPFRQLQNIRKFFFRVLRH